MLFLLAGPGETKFLPRAGDQPLQVEIPLGCGTWFNELSSSSSRPHLSSSRRHFIGDCSGASATTGGLHPGMDNQSASFSRTPSLASAVSAIKGEEGYNSIFHGQLAAPRSSEGGCSDGAGADPCMVDVDSASSSAGGLLEQADPGHVAVVDAMYQLRRVQLLIVIGCRHQQKISLWVIWYSGFRHG